MPAAWWRSEGQRIGALAVAVLVHGLVLGYMVTNRIGTGSTTADPEGVTVEVLNETDFDQRFASAIAAKPALPPPTQPAPPAAASPTSQPDPAPAEATSVADASQPTAAASPPLPAVKVSKPILDDAMATLSAPLPMPQPSLDLSVPRQALEAKPKKRAMTAAEFVARQLGGSARERAGEIDDFTRAVVREIEAAKPVSNGIAGTVVISFVVSVAGDLENLQLTGSSGDSRLDNLVLRSVQGIHVRVPPAFAENRDRTFEITFDYKR